MAGWTLLDELVQKEVVQRMEEGCDVDGFAERVAEAGDDEAQLMAIYNELMALPIRSDFPYEEPSELADIRALRPEGPRKLDDSAIGEAEWRDKFYGAWLGRSVGCALGKPLEAWPYMGGTDNNPGWRNVQLWFEGADAWPIRDYTPLESRARQEHGLHVAPYSLKSTRENIRFMETDDDIRYTVLGLIMLEERGLDFDSYDIGKLWHSRLPYRQVCTAETQAYLNFTQATSHQKPQKEKWQTRKEWVRTYLNPYREWIGAQIRADGFAYGAAGNPELAADLAWRDASFSHVKNGIYGEMFCAAMIAAAFVESDPERLVRIGLSEIPRNCRLSHDIEQAVAIAKEAGSQLELVDRIWEAFKHYHPVHTNNNAALVAASIVFAKGDFELAVTTSVLGGWDTDCNGATVGSIMGASLGAGKLPESWTKPLNDTLYAELAGFHPIPISECASRTYDVFRKLRGGSL